MNTCISCKSVNWLKKIVILCFDCVFFLYLRDNFIMSGKTSWPWPSLCLCQGIPDSLQKSTIVWIAQKSFYCKVCLHEAMKKLLSTFLEEKKRYVLGLWYYWSFSCDTCFKTLIMHLVSQRMPGAFNFCLFPPAQLGASLSCRSGVVFALDWSYLPSTDLNTGIHRP